MRLGRAEALSAGVVGVAKDEGRSPKRWVEWAETGLGDRSYCGEEDKRPR